MDIFTVRLLRLSKISKIIIIQLYIQIILFS